MATPALSTIVLPALRTHGQAVFRTTTRAASSMRRIPPNSTANTSLTDSGTAFDRYSLRRLVTSGSFADPRAFPVTAFDFTTINSKLDLPDLKTLRVTRLSFQSPGEPLRDYRQRLERQPQLLVQQREHLSPFDDDMTKTTHSDHLFLGFQYGSTPGDEAGPLKTKGGETKRWLGKEFTKAELGEMAQELAKREWLTSYLCHILGLPYCAKTTVIPCGPGTKIGGTTEGWMALRRFFEAVTGDVLLSNPEKYNFIPSKDLIIAAVLERIIASSELSNPGNYLIPYDEKGQPTSKLAMGAPFILIDNERVLFEDSMRGYLQKVYHEFRYSDGPFMKSVFAAPPSPLVGSLEWSRSMAQTQGPEAWIEKRMRSEHPLLSLLDYRIEKGDLPPVDQLDVPADFIQTFLARTPLIRGLLAGFGSFKGQLQSPDMPINAAELFIRDLQRQGKPITLRAFLTGGL